MVTARQFFRKQLLEENPEAFTGKSRRERRNLVATLMADTDRAIGPDTSGSDSPTDDDDSSDDGANGGTATTTNNDAGGTGTGTGTSTTTETETEGNASWIAQNWKLLAGAGVLAVAAFLYFRRAR